VQAFFNALPDDEFLELLEITLDGIGIDYNGVGCVLPGEDDESAPESGVLFYVADEEAWLPNTKVITYLKLAVDAYIKTHPQDKLRADRLIARAYRVFV
jgi:hypothetical protein